MAPLPEASDSATADVRRIFSVCSATALSSHHEEWIISHKVLRNDRMFAFPGRLVTVNFRGVF